jgi:hypothetical protein
MIAALRSSETPYLTRATRLNIPEFGILHWHPAFGVLALLVLLLCLRYCGILYFRWLQNSISVNLLGDPESLGFWTSDTTFRPQEIRVPWKALTSASVQWSIKSILMSVPACTT